MTAPTKPPYGQACNNCGQCCADQLCPLGTAVFGDRQGPCPAALLQAWYAPMRRICGLVSAPSRFVPGLCWDHGPKAVADAAAVLIGAGRGCDALAFDEPPNPIAAAAMLAAAAQEDSAAAMAIWNLHPAMGLE